MGKASKKMLNIDEKRLLKQEKNVLREIEDAGYHNPYDDFASAFKTDNNRRYVKSLKVIKYGAIEENQISVNILDKKYCREELLPLIELNGLENPPIVEETAVPGKYKQITGHHRAYTLDMMGKGVPVIEVTSNYNWVDDDVPSDIDLIQGIRANPPRKHRQYTTDDAVYQLSRSLELNPTQDGLNPAGKLPVRESTNNTFDFDDFMNRVMGNEYFPCKATRTKIRNRILRCRVRSKLIDIDFGEQTNHLMRIGWNSGIKPKGRKRKASTDHFDTQRQGMIVVSDDNGRHVDEKLFGIVKKYYQDPGFHNNLVKNGIRYIDILGRIYNPSTDKTSLDSARDNFRKKIVAWKTLMVQMGVNLEIRYLALPKQLKSGSDKDILFSV